MEPWPTVASMSEYQVLASVKVPARRSGKARDNAAQLGHKLLDILVYEEFCREGSRRTIQDLADIPSVADWMMPDLRAAIGYAASQGWIVSDGDSMTLTAAGMAAA